MNSERSLDELRDAVEIFEHESDFLYRYNDPIESTKFFLSLSSRDQRRLLYWALRVGSNKVSDVARCLMRSLSPSPNSLEELSSQMRTDDILEIEEIRCQLHDDSLSDKKVPTESDRRRIIHVLSEASHKIGFLTFEKAYWILLSHNVEDEPKWIECKDQNGSETSTFYVFCNPNREDRVRLLMLMRQSSWIINLHNHPLLPSPFPSLDFSPEDKNYRTYWESLRPELAQKMLWGVVHKDFVSGMPFPLPPHMTFQGSNKQCGTVVSIRESNLVCGMSDRIPDPPVIDAHALYDSMSKREKERLRKYLNDIKKGKRANYSRVHEADYGIIIAVILGLLVAILLLRLVLRSL